MKKFLFATLEIIQTIAIAVAIVIPVRYFLIQPFFVEGASMEPNFHNGQYLIIDEISYRLHEPERGEVIVFKYPANPSQYFIKRVIGLPGETVEVNEEGIFVYNDNYPEGQKLEESSYRPTLTPIFGSARYILGDDEYFVMGDNRGASSDSRHWGSLPRDYIVGRVWIRAWPFNAAEVF